jgi:hypothetical protein
MTFTQLDLAHCVVLPNATSTPTRSSRALPVHDHAQGPGRARVQRLARRAGWLAESAEFPSTSRRTPERRSWWPAQLRLRLLARTRALGADRPRLRAVISSEIADIFRSNALKNGLLPIVLDGAIVQNVDAATGHRTAHRRRRL